RRLVDDDVLDPGANARWDAKGRERETAEHRVTVTGEEQRGGWRLDDVSKLGLRRRRRGRRQLGDQPCEGGHDVGGDLLALDDLDGHVSDLLRNLYEFPRSARADLPISP